MINDALVVTNSTTLNQNNLNMIIVLFRIADRDRLFSFYIVKYNE